MSPFDLIQLTKLVRKTATSAASFSVASTLFSVVSSLKKSWHCPLWPKVRQPKHNEWCMSEWDGPSKKYREFGERLRKAREKHSLSRQELAKRIGVAVSTLQKYEEGGDPKGSALVKIAGELSVSIDDLLGVGNVRPEGQGNMPSIGMEIVGKAIGRTKYKITNKQKEMIAKIINEELEEKAVAIVSALKGGIEE